MLKIECPFCGKLEEREFRDGRTVRHEIVCDECKQIEQGRLTLCNMCTAITVLVNTGRPKLRGEYNEGSHLLALKYALLEAIQAIDLYIDEVPF